MLERKLLPAICASVHSARWQSKLRQAVSQLEVNASIEWQLNIDEAIASSRTGKKAAVIAELPKRFNDQPERTAASIAEACNDPFGTSIFILGEDSHEPAKHLLVEAGAADTCFCMLDFDGFWNRIKRYLNHHSIDEISVEQAVAARLRS